MARAMFRYTKAVLKKVSFSSFLFSLELKKARKRLLPSEQHELDLWLAIWVKRHPKLMKCIKPK
ncbi:hypothetical protein N9L39_00965 [Flavobacteriaceae bacterium]|nr:hypothetical protein [Flavobacteriaceae bacterium]